MTVKRILSTGLLSFWFFLTAFAQVNNKGISVNTPGGPSSNTTHALVIGISKYQNIPSLTYADADAFNFYQFLISSAGGNIDSNNIKLLLNQNATSANIFAALDWLLEVSKEGENVLIYFSGHGDLETKTIMQNGFLLASDAPKSCYMAGGTIGLFYLQTYLNTLIERNKAKVILISDACKSGKLAGGIEGATNTGMALQQQWSNVVKILSSQAGELSQEGKKWGNGAGVFSYYLLNGLKGLADMNRDKKVTLMEAFIYLSENVARETQNTQNPAIVGNQSTVLSYVDSATLASVEKMMQASTSGQDQLAMKGFSDNVLNLLDPGVKELYDKFQFCIRKDYLLEGPDSVGYAWDYYYQLSRMEGAESILNSVKRTLLAALQNKSQIAINTWVKGEDIPDTISTYTAYSELYYAMQLIDSTYIMYDYIKSRYLFWKSVYTEDPDEKLAIMKECVRIEPSAPFAFQQLGSICLTKKDYRQAISYYKKAIELAPNWTFPLNDLGLAYDNLQMTDSAIWYYRHANVIDPSYALSYNNLASIYNSQGKYDSAMILVDKAIGLNPEKGLYYITKGAIYSNQEMYEQAMMLTKEGMEKEPEKADYHYRLALAYYDLDNYSKAVIEFKEAIARDNKVAKYYTELARTYLYMDKYDRAIMELEKAIQLEPGSDGNYILTGRCYTYMGKYAEAIPWYEKGLQLDSTYAYNWRMASWGYRYAALYDKSIAASLKSIKLDSADVWNYYYASFSYDFADDLPNALVYAAKAFQIKPKDEDIAYNYADLLRRNGEADSAIVIYEKALQMKPGVAKCYTGLAYAYETTGNNAQAESNYLKAIEADPGNAARYVSLAQFYLDVMKDYDKAETYYNKAKEISPEDYTIYNGFGYLYLRKNSPKKSEEAFTRAIELAPDVAWNYYNMCCMYSLTGNPKKALQYLKQALDKGMNDIEHIKKDPDLNPIRQEAGFKALMKEYFNVNL